MRHTIQTPRSPLSAAVLAGLIAIGSGTALAQATPPAGPVMGFGQISDAVTQQGYTEIREIERKSDKLYEVDARDSSGLRAELYVDARTGEILKVETKRRFKDRDQRPMR
ncbi:MAG: PepSY domain-containing protein [Burkholderiales bacterium]|nr:MAG: PepSY domain-containing protein [Burkholderiales bacterium]